MEALRSPCVHSAGPSTHVPSPGGAVSDRDTLSGIGGQRVQRRADERERSIGCGEPVLHLLDGEHIGRSILLAK